MTQYTYSHFLSDYVRRTLINHALIEEIKACYEKGEKDFCYEEFFHEYRTKHSDQFPNTPKCDNTVHFYEVTSLINSLYGLVILPVEKFKSCQVQPKSKIDQTVQNIINECKKRQRYYSEDKEDTSTFLRHIRNALAHGGNHGIHFYSIGGGKEQQIGGIIFVDYDIRNQRNLWCIKLTIKELKELTKEIYSFFCNVTDTIDYNKRIQNLERLISTSPNNNAQVRQQVIDDINTQN